MNEVPETADAGGRGMGKRPRSAKSLSLYSN